MEKISVFVVDDEEKLLKSTISKIETLSKYGFDVVGSAVDGNEAFSKIEQIRPKIVITDIKMPNMDGLELSKKLAAALPSITVVILSGFSDFGFAQTAIKYGVCEYLLKPVSTDKLKEVLLSIKNNISARKLVSKFNAGYVSPAATSMLSGEDSEYNIMLASFGNGAAIYGTDTSDRLAEKVSDLDWEACLKQCGVDKNRFMVVNDRFINQYFIITKNKTNDIEGIAAALLQNLKAISKIPVNIYVDKNACTKEQINSVSKTLRNLFKKVVIFGKSDVYLYGNQEKILMSSLIEQQNSYKYFIKSRFDKGELNEIYTELKAFLKSRVTSGISCYVLSVIINGIIDLFDLLKGSHYVPVDEIKEVLAEKMIFCSDVDALSDSIISSLKHMLSENKPKTFDIARELTEYVDNNFTSINLEDISAKFNYNYSYLSRLFKECKNESLTKYIKLKRIECAKKLMAENQYLSLARISQMVGYEDSHYFSRIFKENEGKTPKEYREKITGIKNNIL